MLKNKIVQLMILGAFAAQILAPAVFAVSPSVRIKDIARVLEAHENQLMGFGLVIGLKNTGDSNQTVFTRQALTNLLSHMGIPPQEKEFRSRNVAAVMVTAKLAAFTKTGQKLDVTVSSLGDAISLRGGTLILTPLQGVDGEIYAIAQGPLAVGGQNEKVTVPLVDRAPTTVGIISDGAVVEKEVPVTMGERNILTIVLNNPDFTTASRLAYSITRSGIVEANAKDAATVVIPIRKGVDIVNLVASLENLRVVPDTLAKVVINERTGTIVMGENVRIAPVAVTFGTVTVKISPVDVSASSYGGGDVNGATTTARSTVKYYDGNKKLAQVESGANLVSLIRALNKIGATPSDLVGVLQAIKKSGALSAELEII
ncbi:MAG: flagellar basal body P-ring protein FlgI [bacterium]